MRIVVAALAYFALVFAAGFILGPIRVLVLEPRLGPFAAVLIEAPLLLAAIRWAARIVPRRIGVEKQPASLLGVGLLALVLQQISDGLVGALRGLSFAEQVTRFLTAEGAVYAALLLAFALMPALVNRRP